MTRPPDSGETKGWQQSRPGVPSVRGCPIASLGPGEEILASHLNLNFAELAIRRTVRGNIGKKVIFASIREGLLQSLQEVIAGMKENTAGRSCEFAQCCLVLDGDRFLFLLDFGQQHGDSSHFDL